MTTQTDTIAAYLTAAAQLIRERGHNRRNEHPHHAPDGAPLSVHGALRAAAAAGNANTARTWMPLLGRVNDYWRDTLGVGVWEWEHAHLDRDVTAEVVEHLTAAADYHR